MFNVTKVDLWSAPVEDRVGGLLDKVEALVKAGADLDYLLARGDPRAPGGGMMIVAPLKGQHQIQVAEQLGMQRNDRLYCIHVEGPDEPGSIYRILRALAQEKLSLRELSACAIRSEFAVYLTFDDAEAADRAARRLERPL